MLMLEKLSPVDRAVFLLREAFGHDYHTISEITGRSETACRQTISRAKEKLRQQPALPPIATEEAERLVKEFLSATQSGELAALIALLCEMDSATQCSRIVSNRHPETNTGDLKATISEGFHESTIEVSALSHSRAVEALPNTFSIKLRISLRPSRFAASMKYWRVLDPRGVRACIIRSLAVSTVK